MGRAKQPTSEVIDLPELPVEHGLNQQQMSTLTQEISAQFGDGQIYDRIRVVNEARFYMAQSAEAMLEAGKRLIVLKENEPHGEFESIVREQLGLPERTARLMMQATIKYTSPSLDSKRQALAVLGKTKLFELMTEDDDELVALAEGGTVAGLKLDAIDRMTTRELKRALREGSENYKSLSQLQANTNAERDQLKLDLAKREKLIAEMDPIDVGDELRVEVSKKVSAAEIALRSLKKPFAALAEHTEQHGFMHDDFMAGLLGQLQFALNQLRGEFSIKEAPDGEVMPAWMREEAPLPTAPEEA
ncbi:DUF3102 domain-containing protein [Iodobacter sp. BJB302]|uniref:DUF3102 domain-containing protein n=1 Tax=Iodobacter sp. BJB302 TaxID=1506510 RepID=UPI000C104A62|nr:DUF3102 domain-containing protein [Iodobacter sp. BJB302]PHV02814.1 DUF3102 domain-containing protein [Iodobacter sp. BJB302]